MRVFGEAQTDVAEHVKRPQCRDAPPGRLYIGDVLRNRHAHDRERQHRLDVVAALVELRVDHQEAVAGLGDRPLGVQASQIAAAARWLEKDRGFGPVAVQSVGERTSLSGLIAAALEPKAIGSLASEQSLKSLHDVLSRDLTVRQFPEYFCFGLLERYDIPQMESLVQPRPVSRQ